MLQERAGRGSFTRQGLGGGAVTRHRRQSPALTGEPAPGSAEASAQTELSRAWWVDLNELLACCSTGVEPEEQKQEKLLVKIMMV